MTIDEHHRKNLEMTHFLSEKALYITISNGLLTELSCGYVEDLLLVWTQEFKNISSKTHAIFEMGDRESLPCTFSGLNLWLVDQDSLKQEQRL